MNHDQNQEVPTDDDGAQCATQQAVSVEVRQIPDYEQTSDPFDWVEITIAALGRYLFAGEVTAPMTHRPKMLVNDAGRKSFLVRIFHKDEHQTLCLGEPLNAEQRKEASEFFIHPETNVQKGNYHGPANQMDQSGV